MSLLIDEHELGMTVVNCELTVNELALIAHYLVNYGPESDLTANEQVLLEKIEGYESEAHAAAQREAMGEEE